MHLDIINTTVRCCQLVLNTRLLPEPFRFDGMGGVSELMWRPLLWLERIQGCRDRDCDCCRGASGSTVWGFGVDIEFDSQIVGNANMLDRCLE